MVKQKMNCSTNPIAEIVSAAPATRLDSREWYAVYTQPRHEQAVNRHLAAREVETYLPTILSVNRWKDRRVQIETPVFPGYIFTRISAAERRQVVAAPGVVRVLSFNGAPAAIADTEIEAVKLCLARGVAPQTHPYLAVGERVRVRSGALEGLQGLVTRRKNECRLIVSVTLIHRSVAIEIDEDALESLEANATPASRRGAAVSPTLVSSTTVSSTTVSPTTVSPRRVAVCS
jgi:transcription antitermination factor NusG